MQRQLLDAVRQSLVLELQLLLAQGACPDTWCWDHEVHWTALHLACHRGCLESARVLLEAGANPDLVVSVSSRPHFLCHNGCTQWQMACAWEGRRALDFAEGNLELICLLLSHGARPTQELHESLLRVHSWLQAQHHLGVHLLAMRADWGREAGRKARQCLERGELVAARGHLNEAFQILGEQPGLKSLRRELDDRDRLNQLEPPQLHWECRRRLRLDPGNMVWLKPLLRATPESSYAGLLEELQQFNHHLGQMVELPLPWELLAGLDDLPPACLVYLSRRLTG